MKRIKRGFIGIIILLITMGGGFCVFSSYVNNLSKNSMESLLKETAMNNVFSMETLFKNDTKSLNGISNQIVTQMRDVTAIEVTEIINNSLSLTNFDHIVLFSLDGSTYSDVEERLYEIDEVAKEVMNSGESRMASIYEDGSIGIDVAIVEDNEIHGVLRGIYKTDSILRVLNTRTFDGMGYFSMVNTNGGFLYQTNKTEDFYYGNDAFEILKQAQFADGFTLQDIKKAMKQEESFLASYTIDGEKRTAYYMPSGISDWYVLSAVPSSYMMKQAGQVELATFILMLLMAIIFVILLYVIHLQNRRTKKQLQDEFEGIEKILGAVPLPMMVIGVDHKIHMANDAACEVFHRSRQDMIDQPCNTLHTNICDTKNCAIKQLLKGHNVSFMKVDHLDYQVVSTALADEQNEVIGYIEIMRDVSEQMKTQHDLEERTLELETISENLMGGILITSLDENISILRCNQGYLDMIGANEKDVIGESIAKWLLNEDANTIENSIIKQLKEDGVVRLERILVKETNEKIWISVFGKVTKLQNQPAVVWLLVNIDNRKQAELKVLINEQRYRIALKNTEDIIIDYDLETNRMLHDDKVMDAYDVPLSVENPQVNIVKAGIIAKESIEDFVHMLDELHQGAKKVSYEILTHPKKGGDVWCRMTFTTIFDTMNKPVRAVGIVHNINDEKHALQNYKREAQYRKITTEDAALYYEADLTSKIFLSGHEELLRAYADDDANDFDTVVELMLNHLVYSNDREFVRNHISWEALWKFYQNGETKVDFEYQRILGSEQSLGWVQCTIYMLEDEETHHILVIGYIKDIDEAKKLELYLKKQAEQDLLTGLYNKITTENMIKESLLKKEDGLCALIIIDLDDFKRINDSLGHAFGDAVLSEVSQHLKDSFRKDDVVGRVGGDEFIAYLRRLGNEQEAINRAASICKMFHSSYTGAKNYKVSGSLGIAFAPKNGTDFETLYRKADIALYSAKNGGKDMYCAFHEELPQIGSQVQPRIIDTNYGKQLSENIGEFVLRILYEAKKPEKVINAILELLSRQYGYSRGYIFEHNLEDDDWVNTYEWCEIGIPTQKDDLQKMHFSSRNYYENLFDENGVYMMSDTKDMDAEVYEFVKNMNLQSFVQFALKTDGVIRAFIGFDDWKGHRVLDKAAMETLHNVVMLLDVFVFRNKNSNLK